DTGTEGGTAYIPLGVGGRARWTPRKSLVPPCPPALPGASNPRNPVSQTLRALRDLTAAFTLPLALACGGADGRPASAEPPPREFDGARAMAYVREQLEFGARVPGTAAHRAMGDWLV